MRDDLEWRGCLAPPDDTTIRAVEATLGVRLPADYLGCVRRFHGGSPTPSEFSYVDPDLGPVRSCIGNFFSLSSARKDNLLAVRDWVRDRLPAQIVPIANDPGGDLICLDY